MSPKKLREELQKLAGMSTGSDIWRFSWGYTVIPGPV
jgi:hypothetical protein